MILWVRGKIVGQDHIISNIRIKIGEDDHNLLREMSSEGTPRAQEREALTCRTSRPIAKMLVQARLMVQTER